MSLLLTLRNTTTGLSAEELVASVPGYGLADPSTNPLSARRKFERDKDTLRELGIDVTTTGRPEEPRYRVIEEDYTLPALHLSAEQAACLSLAASAWRDGDLPATARRALTKLRAVSEGPTGAAPPACRSSPRTCPVRRSPRSSSPRSTSAAWSPSTTSQPARAAPGPALSSRIICAWPRAPGTSTPSSPPALSTRTAPRNQCDMKEAPPGC